MSGKKINVAVLGAGNIARSMAAALAGIPDAAVMYAVGSRSLDKAEKFAKEYGFEKAYGSYEELAADDKIDLIYIATPHSEHYENAKLCLAHGRNLLVEKAFCGNRKQAKEILDIAKEKNILVAEAMWTRYMPFVNQVKKLIENDAIGKVSYVESDFSIRGTQVERLVEPKLAGGALLDLGIYSITIPDMFLGDDIIKIDTECILHETGVDRTDVINFTYADGTKATAKTSFDNEPQNYAKIVGDKGYMTFGPINVPEYIDIFDNAGNKLQSLVPEKLVNGYEYEVLSCKKALEEGILEVPELPHSQILKMMGWMDSLRNFWGVHYPFETKEDIELSDIDVWGKENVLSK